MDVICFNDLVSSERKARRFFLDLCWKNHQRFCPRCRERKLYKVADGRRRCSRCGYTFQDFSRRFLNACAFDCRQWLWFLKLFELAVPPRDMAVQMRVTYPTVLKTMDVVRRAIAAQSLDADALLRAGCVAGRRDSPVFGIIIVNGMVLCDVLPEISLEDMLLFKCNFRLRTAAIGQVVYTAPYRNYLALTCCGPSLWPSNLIRHEDKRLPLEATEFWGLARRHLERMRGLAPRHYSLYLKEWEMRHNCRDTDLLAALARALCGFMPDG
ncbi:putative transposase [hydrocarbon metagenome]|uniref:Putative transposase n=1 Tax=hydrocarbon metagenome TaxID=938273 RepID=A0A0W8G2T1_9ZZZZ